MRGIIQYIHNNIHLSTLVIHQNEIEGSERDLYIIYNENNINQNNFTFHCRHYYKVRYSISNMRIRMNLQNVDKWAIIGMNIYIYSVCTK